MIHLQNYTCIVVVDYANCLFERLFEPVGRGVSITSVVALFRINRNKSRYNHEYELYKSFIEFYLRLILKGSI